MIGQFVAVAFGAALGAVGRYLIDQFVQARSDSVLPWGTFTVNVVGSLVFGFLVAGTVVGAVPGLVFIVMGAGLCGSLTTFSTFGFETLRLAESGARGYALLNVGLTLLAGLGAALLGWIVALALWG